MSDSSKVNLSLFNINVLCGRYVELNSDWNATNVCSPFSRIYMITEGEGCLRYGETELIFKPGNIYVIPAGLRISFSTETSLSKSFFHISIPTPTGYDLLEQLDRCIVFNDSASICKITEELKSHSFQNTFSIKAYIYHLVYKFLVEMGDIRIQRSSELITRTVEYINKNLYASLTVENIAEAVFVSSAKLRKTFRDEMEIPIGQYISDRIIIQAEEMIRTSNISIKEVSDSLGFCDQFYFSRCFTKKFGLSPSEYRKNINT